MKLTVAGKNKEYWDNWQGWHTPKIYKAEDCEEVEAKGYITIRDKSGNTTQCSVNAYVLAC